SVDSLPFLAMILLLFLLACALGQVDADAMRMMQVGGSINCLDGNGESRPLTVGSAQLMEEDMWPNPDDLISHADLSDRGAFYLKGYDPEMWGHPEYYLQFTLPCPPPAYCVDRVWKYECGGQDSVAFSYFLDL
ncbi:hypothetical protein PFISCL1PPCAC_1036, partial [Pristionchus fissidentatus]